MEEWSVRDDRPYVRPEENSYAWVVPAVAVIFIAVIAAAVAWWQLRGDRGWGWSAPEAKPELQASAAPAPPPPPQAAARPAQPEVRHPIPEPAPQPKAKPLPTLEMSDSMARESLVELLGRKAFDELVLPVHLVRRIVATVDNLPRATAPQRMMPLKQVPGAFVVAPGSADEATLDAKNFARYAPYVRVLESANTRALVATYVRAYPLFQRAYRELGYPEGHFNDRLIEAIDDMLAAPEVKAPIKLLRPKVLYEFADPDLETASAGQKIMVRMGSANAARVKAKLREIRREIIAASEARTP